MSTFELLIFIVFIITVIFFSTQWWLKPHKKLQRIVPGHDKIEPTDDPELPPWGEHTRGASIQANSIAADVFDESQLASFGFSKEDALFPKEESDPLFDPIPPRTEARTESKINRPAPSKSPGIVVFNILAPAEQAFVGYELLQALLGADFRFGEMSIFHRHEDPSGKGEILFSVAQAMEPGIFNMDEIGGLNCAGLSIFMRLTSPNHNLKAFELMVDTAQQLAEDLGGIVTDVQRTPITVEVIKTYRQLVQEHQQSFA